MRRGWEGERPGPRATLGWGWVAREEARQKVAAAPGTPALEDLPVPGGVRAGRVLATPSR